MPVFCVTVLLALKQSISKAAPGHPGGFFLLHIL